MTPAVVAATIVTAVVIAVPGVPVRVGAQAQAPAVAWPSEGPPRPLAAHDSAFPPYQLRTLPNGLQVMAVLHHEQPVVSMRLLVRAGSASDPKGKLGLADLAASLLDQGTTTKSATEMNDAIDFMGGDMGAGAGTDLTFVTTVVMKDSFETGLRMLSDMARHPAFDPAEIDRQRRQMLSGLQVSLESPEFIANMVFDRLVYGAHPYGQPETGTPETLAAITRDDLLGFHRRNFVPNNAILAVVGDLSADEAFNGVSKVFGDWERRDVPPETFTAPPEPARRVVVVDKPDAVQTEVRVGHLGVKRNIPDYLALNLALRILGGEGANRLHQVLRTERSLTYGAEAQMDTLEESGDFEATTNTRTEATGEVVRLIVDEFWRMQRERVSERELNDAKAYMTGTFPLTIETPDAIATQILNVLFYGLPVQELQTYRARVNRITPDDVQRVSRIYLRPDRLSIVLVGDAAGFVPQLRTNGFDTFETIEMDALDLTAADLKRPSAGRTPPRPGFRGLIDRATRARDWPARISYTSDQATQAAPPPGVPAAGGQAGAPDSAAVALLDQVIAAKGGLATLRGVKSITAVTAAASDSPQGRVDVQSTTYLQYPNRVRVETTLPGQTLVQVYDGERAWVKDARGVHDVPDRAARELDASFKRDLLTLLLAAHDGSVHVRLLPDAVDETGQTRRVLELTGLGLEPIALSIDPATHLVSKQTYAAPGAGQPAVEELFGDYKPVSGIQIAFTARVRQGGRAILERRVTDIKINQPLDPSLFRRPPS